MLPVFFFLFLVLFVARALGACDVTLALDTPVFVNISTTGTISQQYCYTQATEETAPIYFKTIPCFGRVNFYLQRAADASAASHWGKKEWPGNSLQTSFSINTASTTAAGTVFHCAYTPTFDFVHTAGGTKGSAWLVVTKTSTLLDTLLPQPGAVTTSVELNGDGSVTATLSVARATGDTAAGVNATSGDYIYDLWRRNGAAQGGWPINACSIAEQHTDISDASPLAAGADAAHYAASVQVDKALVDAETPVTLYVRVRKSATDLGALYTAQDVSHAAALGASSLLLLLLLLVTFAI